jgi:protein-S-isoprenylcysteine O-methyltransferase Ste14
MDDSYNDFYKLEHYYNTVTAASAPRCQQQKTEYRQHRGFDSLMTVLVLCLVISTVFSIFITLVIASVIVIATFGGVTGMLMLIQRDQWHVEGN